jgi:hypothetical protein
MLFRLVICLIITRQTNNIIILSGEITYQDKHSLNYTETIVLKKTKISSFNRIKTTKVKFIIHQSVIILQTN